MLKKKHKDNFQFAGEYNLKVTVLSNEKSEIFSEIWSNISSMRRSVSFTVSNAWYHFSNKMILEGEIKDAKMNRFSSDFQTLIKH